jgi:hypothetical protein
MRYTWHWTGLVVGLVLAGCSSGEQANPAGPRLLPPDDATEVRVRGQVDGDFGGVYASDGEYFRLIVSAPESPEFDLEQESEDAGRTVIEIPGVGKAAIVCDGSEGPDQSGSLTWLAGGRRVQLRVLPSESPVCDPTGSLEQPLVRQALTMRQVSGDEVEAFLRDNSA